MYNHVALGGTFDGLHAGHKYFLASAFKSGARVTIGLTSQKYIQKYKKGKGVSPYSRRYNALTSWLRREGYSSRVVVLPLHDPFGPTLMPDGFDAIAVTRDNRHQADAINTKRQDRGLPPLAIVEVDLVSAHDLRPISSTRVRAGVITREGRLILPDSLRPQLQKPLGIVLTGQNIEKSILANRDNVTISVGDVATQTLFSFGVQPSLAIIDLYVERKPYQSFAAYKFPKKYRVVRVQSGPGFIAKKAVNVIKTWSKHVRERTVLVVTGEEDLLAIPAIMYAPTGSVVYYGQPPAAAWACGPLQEGLVEVTINADKQREARELLKRFI